MVWMGVGVLPRDDVTFNKQKTCLKLAALREEVSLERVNGWKEQADGLGENDIDVMLSADLSFGYKPYSNKFNPDSDVNEHKVGNYF